MPRQTKQTNGSSRQSKTEKLLEQALEAIQKLTAEVDQLKSQQPKPPGGSHHFHPALKIIRKLWHPHSLNHHHREMYEKLEEENKRLRQKITTELKEKEKVNFLKDLTHEEVYEPFDTEVKKDLPLYLTAIKEQLVKDEPYNS